MNMSRPVKISLFSFFLVLAVMSVFLVFKFKQVDVEASSTVEILTGAATSSWATSYAPYNTYYMDSIAQSIYLKSDLEAAGIVGPSTISEICFQCSALAGRDIANFRIKMKNTAATVLSAFDTTGLTVVYGPTSYTKPAVGAWKCHTLTAPFNWDGTSNLLIEAYRNDSAWTSGGGNYVRTAASGRTYAGFCDNCTGCGVGQDCYTPSSRTSFAQVMSLKLTYTAANPSPNTPTLVSPGDGASDISLTPTLQFGYSDPAAESATKFDLKIDDNADFSSPVINLTDYSTGGPWASGSTINHTVVAGGLSVNGHYYWKVRAYDGTGWSSWSDGTWDFFTIANNSPDTPVLISPSQDSTGVSSVPTLQFSYSDFEGNNCAQFDLQVDDNSDFSSPIINETNYSTGGPWASGSTISYSAATELIKGTKYYWKARVNDGTSWSSWSGGTGLNLGSMKSLSTERYSSCAVSDAGNVYCWGWNNYRKIGNNTTSDSRTPARVLGVGGSGYLTGAEQVETGSYHACVLKTGGTVYCWGDGESGQLGNNTTNNSYTPVQTLGVGGSGYLTGVDQVDAGTYHACAVKTDGTAYCWGYNIAGQIGNNTLSDQLVPAQVKGVGGSGYLTGVSQIAAGYQNTCAVKTDGTVYCWGDNASGQIGNNTTTDSSVPVQVLGAGGSGYLTDVSQVEVGDYPYGDYHACAVKTDGTVYCWGANGNGRLGNNTTTASLVPVQVVGIGGSGYLTGINQVEVGERNVCALKSNGTVYCWGGNNNGQLGNNTTTDSYSPVQTLGIGGSGYLTDISELGAGVYDSCALKSDGTVYCWGDNAYGQLGNNTTTDSYVPVKVLRGEAQSGDTDFTWSFTSVEPNNIPSVSLISPNEGASGISFTPNLQFQYFDMDFSSCTKFDLQVDNDRDFASPAVNLTDYSVGGPWTNGSTISYTVPSALTPGTRYYWRVRAHDGEDWSEWSGNFSDDFNDNSIGTNWSDWAFNSAVVAESGQQIAITPAVSVTDSIGGVETISPYDLRGGSVSVNVKQVSAGDNVDTALMLWKDDDNVAQIIYTVYDEGDAIVAEWFKDGVEYWSSSTTYNSVTMAWWRIREDSGTAYFEYSADGSSWTALTSIPDPFSFSSLIPKLISYEYASDSSAGPAWFDNFSIEKSQYFTTKTNSKKFTLKKSDGCFCFADSECYGGTCGGNICGGSVSGPNLTNLTPSSNTSENYCKCWLDASDEDKMKSGLGGQASFSWIYEDSNGIPLASYELKVSEENDPINGAVVLSQSNNISKTSGSQVDTVATEVKVGSIPGYMSYNKTYYWWAKACNADSICTDWIAGPSFSTPEKRYPITGIAWANEKIISGEDIQFCTTADINNPEDPCYEACYKGSASPAEPNDPTEIGTEWVCSTCFKSGDSGYYPCQDVAGTQYSWIFPDLTEGDDYTFVSSTSATSANPIVKFTTVKKGQMIKLRVSGSTCGTEIGSDILFPNPVWKETNPF
jgi:alpha-tubulin suppressor-like RCC1 family protein